MNWVVIISMLAAAIMVADLNRRKEQLEEEGFPAQLLIRAGIFGIIVGCFILFMDQ